MCRIVYKRIVCVVLALVLGVVFCGCSDSGFKAKSVDQIKDYVVDKNYYDEKNFNSYSADGCDSFGGVMTNEWTMFFFDFGDDSDSADEYINLTLSEIELTDARKKDNCTIYEGDGEPNYCLFVRIDNTIFEVYGPKADKTAIRAFATDIGYYASP